jgi:predicted Zn-dependent protease
MKKYFFRSMIFSGIAASLVTFQSCKDKDGDLNLFSISDDIALGKQVVEQLESDPTIKVVDSASHVAIYRYIYNLRDSVLVHNELNYEQEFSWRIRIIKDDSTLNAFCTPGGYIYIYTALIRYLESEDQLAGVMGHEMAHADKRHSTDALTRQYGLSTLFDIVFGKDKGQLIRVASQIKELQYSRKHETEADMMSVQWLYPTAYNAKGAAGFFQFVFTNVLIQDAVRDLIRLKGGLRTRTDEHGYAEHAHHQRHQRQRAFRRLQQVRD